MPSKLSRKDIAARGEMGRRIKEERKRLNLTVRAAAELMDMEHPHYFRLEGPANHRILSIFELVDKIGMDPKALVPELFGEPPKKKNGNVST